MRPFVILALPRSGTKMLVSALNAHPEMPNVIHEFRGGLLAFLKHPYVLSNKIKWWMRWPIKIMHLGREDTVDHALSLLKMPYDFPDGEFELPISEVEKSARESRELQARMKKRAQFTLTYEELTGNKDVNELPKAKEICGFFGVKPRKLTTITRKRLLMRASNETEICSALKT